MKKYILFFALIVLMNLNSFTQGFTNYKALITDDSGAILVNQAVSVRFTVFDNDPNSTGVQVFQETHATTTDANGIIVLNIGESNAADWFSMDWSVPTHYLKTEYDTNSGFVDMGTQAFRTVPYSQYAFKSQYSIYAQQASEVNFSNITNVPVGLADGDDDTHLTDAQITSMGYIKDANDADNDPTNEIELPASAINGQVLTWNGSVWEAQNIGTGGDNWGTQTAVTSGSINGNGTSGSPLGVNTSDNLFSGWDKNAADDFDGSFSSLTNVPSGLSDGDDNTQLTETQVDNFVANNGYATALNGLWDAKTDGNSVFIGFGAGLNNDGTNNYNTAIGNYALYSNTTGNYNTANGIDALHFNNMGNNNMANGASALYFNEDGNFNTAIGRSVLYSNENGNNNTACGGFGLFSNITGNNNTAIGDHAGYNNQTGNGNVFLGNNAGFYEEGSNKLYIENSLTLTPLIGGDFSTDEVIINGTLQITGGTPGAGKVFTSDANGKGSWENTTNELQTISKIGSTVTLSNGGGSFTDDNTQLTETEVDNFVANNGYATELNDLSDAKIGGGSVFIGEGAGQNDDGIDNYNTAIGENALYANTTGYNNTANGFEALYNNTGTDNTAIGKRALYRNTTGSNNTANGNGALYHNDTGNVNTATGSGALYMNSTGYGNTAIGFHAGMINQAGNKNVFLGYSAGSYETGSDKLYIENSGSSTPLIGGDFATDEVTINGNLLTIDNVGADADLLINSSGTYNPGVHYYLDDAFKASTGYSVSNDAYFVYHNGNTYFKNGNILPDGHKTRDLGADGTAWDDVYADNFVNQGAAAFTDRSVTNEIITHPPIAKKDGDFDAQTKGGLYELNPDSLPNALRTKNGIKIDEIATYNYKANYEQQVLINKQQSEIEALKLLINKQQTLLKQLVKDVQTLK